MPRPPDRPRKLFTLPNLAVLVIALAVGYLLFGKTLTAGYHEDTRIGKEGAHQVSNDEFGTGTEDGREGVINGIHVETGLVYGEGFETVRGNCTGCHSAKLITQNRATREGWTAMIRWMQEKQGLRDLGDSEPVILAYLAANYAPQEVGRRAGLDAASIEWYVLDLAGEE